ncbi:hypothetical protein [Sphingobacterium detergens]
MENQEIIIITVVAVIALLLYATYYWKNEYEKLWCKVKSPSQIPTSPNPPPPPRTFIERSPYQSSEKRLKALRSLIDTASLLDLINDCPKREEINKCLAKEIELILKAQNDN